MKTSLILLAAIGFACVLADDKKRNIVASFEVLDQKCQLEIKIEDGFHEFCMRFPVEDSSPLKFLASLLKKESFKACVGLKHTKTAEKQGKISVRVRAGKNVVLQKDVQLKRNIPTCTPEIQFLGKVCLKDISVEAETLPDQTTKRTFCLLIIAKKPEMGYNVCGSFIGTKYDTFKFVKATWKPEWTKALKQVEEE